jgi:RNA polymerase-associated protein CTR9
MYYLDAAFQGVDIKTFTDLYGKAMSYAQKAYKLSQHLPSAALVLAQYFYSKRNYTNVIKLCEKVLEYTDVRSIQSDAYYWIGRTHHQLAQYDRAMAFYQRSRATNETNLPAAIGIGQLQALQNDLISAKLTFERLLEQYPKCIEALTILGFIYANEANDRTNKMDKGAEKAKAKGFFDRALKLIEETPGRSLDDPMLCLAQSQLCESDDIDMALKRISPMTTILTIVLEQAKELQPESASPQLINNIAVLQHTKGDLPSAQLLYQSAWAETVKLAEEDPVAEKDDMLITLSYNLGRLEEDANNLDEARKTYQNIIQKHPDYVDAVARLCYLDALTTSFDPSSKFLKDLLLIDPSNLEMRSLIGWHLSRQRRSKSTEDQEQKHYVATLRHFDKHDTYSLVSLANTTLRHARELRPQTEVDKEKRKKEYARAVELFQKALELQPKNAYAAQGVAIAFAEEKNYVQANMIFNKVKETLRDTSVSINMGHCYADQRDWVRAIQNVCS